MEHVLEIKDLRKNFGSICAVNGLSIQVKKGSVYGILGPNGSGKTTTLGILLGVVMKYTGSFSWFGNEDHSENRKQIGALLEQPNFYVDLSAKDNLRIVSLIKNVPEDDIYRVAKFTGLESRLNDKFKNYSLGMKQRLGIASALLGNPKVLILDEPTNGLDPQGIIDVRNLIKTISSEGVTVIIASHALDEIEKVCTHVCVIKDGIQKAEGKLTDIISGDNILEISSDDLIKLKQVILEFESIRESDISLEQNIYHLGIQKGMDVSKLNKHIMDNGISVTHFSTRTKSLEEFFIQTTQS
ncbi:ABC transporter ATP-binding protein [Crocinitomicaceae bacterium]|nr:ABC transporter ATP-binding protein [Crocinitomicaceae bacterium]